MTRKRKKTVSKKKRNKLCYDSNESLYVLVATIKEKETEVTTKKKIFQLLMCNTPSTTTITTVMGKYLRNKVNILTNERKKGSFYQSIHSPGSDDDGLTKKKEQKKEITTIMQKKNCSRMCYTFACFGLKEEKVGNSLKR